MTDTLPLVLEERHGPTLLLTLNRPERHHALNRALSEQLDAAVVRAEADPEVRVIVLTGGGDRAFCAGADMVETSGADGARTAANAGNGQPARAAGAGGAIARITMTPLPVIAAVNGYCYGGGAALAIACDIRLASDTATFRLPGVEYGLVVAAASLPRLVGAAKAKELIYTARRFDAAEAFACGLVNAVYEQTALLPAALAMAETIAANSVAAVRASKQVIDAATLSDAARTLEAEVNRTLRGSPEQIARFRDATQRVTGRTVPQA
ncbi:MAG: enoyl-CoA hydratase/isomerase family protein [Dehalococcoidia bacterium]